MIQKIVRIRNTKYILALLLGKAVPFVEMVVAHSSILTISAISFERVSH